MATYWDNSEMAAVKTEPMDMDIDGVLGVDPEIKMEVLQDLQSSYTSYSDSCIDCVKLEPSSTSQPYVCGSCNSRFDTTCKLHAHIQDHGLGGSYHYDHKLRTAYPKYDSVCSETQTFQNIVVLNPHSMKASGSSGSNILIKRICVTPMGSPQTMEMHSISKTVDPVAFNGNAASLDMTVASHFDGSRSMTSHNETIVDEDGGSFVESKPALTGEHTCTNSGHEIVCRHKDTVQSSKSENAEAKDMLRQYLNAKHPEKNNHDDFEGVESTIDLQKKHCNTTDETESQIIPASGIIKELDTGKENSGYKRGEFVNRNSRRHKKKKNKIEEIHWSRIKQFRTYSRLRANLFPGYFTKKYADKCQKRHVKVQQSITLAATKRQQLALEQKRKVTQGADEEQEGATCQSGIGHEEEANINTIPEAVPKGDFQPVKLNAKCRLVSFHLETTGLARGRTFPQITQIAAMDVKTGRVYTQYVLPTVSIKASAEQATGISVVGGTMLVKGQPVRAVGIHAAIESFCAWLGQRETTSVLAAHNIRRVSDISILLYACGKAKLLDHLLSRAPVFIDTLSVAKKLCPDRSSYKLADLAMDLTGATYRVHDAAEYVRMLGKLVSHVPPDMLQPFSFSTKAVHQNQIFNEEKARNLPTLNVLVANGICKRFTAEHIAGSGLNIEHLRIIYEAEGEDGLQNIFSTSNSEGLPRVTNACRVLEAVIPALVKFFKAEQDEAGSSFVDSKEVVIAEHTRTNSTDEIACRHEDTVHSSKSENTEAKHMSELHNEPCGIDSGPANKSLNANSQEKNNHACESANLPTDTTTCLQQVNCDTPDESRNVPAAGVKRELGAGSASNSLFTVGGEEQCGNAAWLTLQRNRRGQFVNRIRQSGKGKKSRTDPPAKSPDMTILGLVKSDHPYTKSTSFDEATSNSQTDTTLGVSASLEENVYEVIHGAHTKQLRVGAHSDEIDGKLGSHEKPAQKEKSVNDREGKRNAQLWLCKVCFKEFPSKWKLYIHSHTHMNSKEFPCKYCGKVFKLQHNLASHINGKRCSADPNREMNEQCELCGKQFYARGSLRAHITGVHSEERKYVCNVCGACFKFKTRLNTHMRIHSDKPQFKCETCGKSFRQPANLQRHEKLHTGEGKLKCEQCGKRFRCKWNLTTHQRQHSGAKPYTCEKCGEGFTFNVSRKAHMKKCPGP